MNPKIDADYRQIVHVSGTVLTNGCYDLLTVAHIRLLQKAAMFGRRLVVAINSDASIETLKGPTRPINTLWDRMEVLSALSCVDVVTCFPDNNVANVIRSLRPHCWVKGGDYSMESLDKFEVATARDVGATIVILEKFGDYSTTKILKKLTGVEQALFTR